MPRHLSFVETGRAQPSREMLLHLSEGLEIPLRERNSPLGVLSFMSTTTVFGTPVDVTLSEIALELFPTDEETERLVRGA